MTTLVVTLGFLQVGAAPSQHTTPAGETEGNKVAQLAELTQRLGVGSVDALRAAIAQRNRIAATVTPVPGGANTWQPVGVGPLRADDPQYSVYGEGFGRLAGRIADFFYDSSHHRILAAVASGGVWQTTDMGQSWTSLGDDLPIQQVSSVAYTPASGGTIVALTGDNAFGGYTYAGLGAYWTSNDGKTWNRSLGIPDGAMGFKIAVNPQDPKVMYAATGVGLFRSADAGRTFTNVDLPTGACHGDSFKTDCFLANIVTDVVVQAKDTFGHAGGAVLAVVGWRAGDLKYPDGVPQSAGNGLYVSDTGKPGTFTGIDEDAAGFAKQANIGRVELGAAEGSDQNHGYVYALVQDAKLFQTHKVEGLDQIPDADPLGLGIDPTHTPTYLNGVYVSSDFGKTWSLMADRKQFEDPATGSGIGQLIALGDAPGIQSWYDQWIKPDPTRSVNGIPTRIELGLEEVWETRDTHTPKLGPSEWKVTGPYTAGGGLCIVIVAEPACSALRAAPGYSSTHPDQHAGIWIPDGNGGVTLVVGNDGGAYTQHLDANTGEVTAAGFGAGANDGFHTLLPYGVGVANDGVIYAGLQDNGELRIEPDGTQSEVFGGDGVFTVVDPANSNVAYEETPGNVVRKTTDGGVNWTSIDPSTDNAGFYGPIAMDGKNARHLLAGGRQVVETTRGSDTTSGKHAAGKTGTSWVVVYDLGTLKHPGVATPTDDVSDLPVLEPGDIQNQISALGVSGNAAYAGFCGSCDPLLDRLEFHAGIAANEGGDATPKSETSDGWHIAKATGLPNRYITSITVDPTDAKTIYVTLGVSTLRPYISAKGYKVYKVSDAGGFLYKSTDAGNTFFDISGNLPKIGGTWTVLRGDQLLVGSTAGVFASTTSASAAAPGHPLEFAVLGHGLPAAPVFSMALKANDPNTLIVGTLGRGVYRYTFSGFAPQKKTTNVLGKRTNKNLPATGVDVTLAWFLVALAVGVAVRMRRTAKR